MAKGQLRIGNSSDIGKQRLALVALSSCSSNTLVADSDMWKVGHGLQEYCVPFADILSGCSLKEENSSMAQCIRVPVNETDTGFLSDIRTLPAALNSAGACDTTWCSAEFLRRKWGPTQKPSTCRSPSSLAHWTLIMTADAVNTLCDTSTRDEDELRAMTRRPADVPLLS
jgi:hypothetical protein